MSTIDRGGFEDLESFENAHSSRINDESERANGSESNDEPEKRIAERHAVH